MELVRNHRRIGRVIGRGTIDNRPYLRVEWHDWTVEAVDEISVKRCPEAGVKDWAFQSVRDTVSALQRLGVDNALDIVAGAVERAREIDARPRAELPF